MIATRTSTTGALTVAILGGLRGVITEMTRTEELLALAEAATSGPWDTNPADALSSELEVTANNHYISICDAAPYDALFIAASNPETIKQLVELVRLQHEALRMNKTPLEDYFTQPRIVQMREALEAFNKWENGK
jgi:hypothetical protein